MRHSILLCLPAFIIPNINILHKLIKHRRSGTSVSTMITEFNICDRKEKGPVKCLMVAAVVAGQRFLMA